MARTRLSDDDNGEYTGPKIEPGIPVPGNIDEEHRRAVNATAALLAARPKVRVRIPLPPGLSREEALKMDKPPHVPICINGYVIDIRKGDAVEVPDLVANLLEEANII